MKMRIRRWLIMGLAMGSAVTLSQDAFAYDFKLIIVIYDHANVSTETLSGAEDTASTVFGNAGVQLVWREGFAYAAERRSLLNPAPEDPVTLVVKLQPESEAPHYGVRSVCGGIALGPNAIIFVRFFDATWIGYVVAHELGHILLGPHAHSIVGIMRRTLLPEEWTKAAQRTLGFTSSQNQQIRTWIAEKKPSLTI